MKRLADFDVQGKRVLVRCDFNIPLDDRSNVLNDFRIVQSLPTIRYLLQNKARIILMSHLGQPGGEVVQNLKLDFVQGLLSKHLGIDIVKAEDCVGPDVQQLVSQIQESEVLLLENLRFHKEEELNGENFAKELASLGEIYVNDAFSVSHRNHASIAGVPKFLPSSIGLLMEKELEHLEKFSNDPERPFVVVVGGMKAKDKTSFINAVSKRADAVLLGNLVANEAVAEHIVFENPEKVIFPQDGIPGNGQEYDIGPRTRDIFFKHLEHAGSVFWTGPLGQVYKKEYTEGSRFVAEAIIKSKAFSVAGGGNLSAFLGAQGLRDKFSHVSTGGGASLAFLAGERLPGLEVLGYYEKDYGNKESHESDTKNTAGD